MSFVGRALLVPTRRLGPLAPSAAALPPFRRRFESTAPPSPKVTALYNGSCPICRVEIEHYQRIAARRGSAVGFSDAVADPSSAERCGVGSEDAKKRLHAIDADGRVHAGVDAFLLLWKELPGYRWLGKLVSLPVIRPVAVWTYDRVLAPALYAAQKRRERRAIGT
ncbi:hypothetical protein DFJ74DRAFT_669216 [Hyaloraphidium curvatum]|nr:hypothetical protein DFJ74DRAFT_669216 [Hyaloraphidium curvatum]